MCLLLFNTWYFFKAGLPETGYTCECFAYLDIDYYLESKWPKMSISSSLERGGRLKIKKTISFIHLKKNIEADGDIPILTGKNFPDGN